MPTPDARKRLFAGVDVGGTNIKVGIVDDAGQSVGFESFSTEQQLGAESAMQRAAGVVAELAGAGGGLAAITAVGLVTPGPLDLAKGMLIDPGNLPAWHGAPVRDLLVKATGGLPVTYANDANAAAYGEYWRGAGQEYDSLVMITLGTGVGGGVILGDQLIEGAHGAGGEIGHIVIDSADDAPLNSLGLRGTLEGYCGSYGVVGRAEAALADHYVESSLRDSISEDETLTPLMIANAAEAGDEVATKVVIDTARYLAIGIATCVHTIDPETVVIGGKLTFGGAGHALGERFLAEVREQARRRIIKSVAERVAIDFAQLGGDAGYIGAAGLARRAADDATNGDTN